MPTGVLNRLELVKEDEDEDDDKPVLLTSLLDDLMRFPGDDFGR